MKLTRKKDKTMNNITTIINSLKKNTNKLGVARKIDNTMFELLANGEGIDKEELRLELIKHKLLIGASGGSSESEQMTNVRNKFLAFLKEQIELGNCVQDTENPEHYTCKDSNGDRRLVSLNFTNLDARNRKKALAEKMLKKEIAPGLKKK